MRTRFAPMSRRPTRAAPSPSCFAARAPRCTCRLDSPSESDSVTLGELAAARRTHKAFGAEPVRRETLLELFDLARLAPNHHLTQPWRFRVLGPETLERIKDAAGP